MHRQLTVERAVGKLRNHSGNYGAGPGVLVNEAIKREIPGITYKFSKQILEAGHRQVPGLKKWWRHVERTIRTARSLETCLGRKRYFFGRFEHATYRAAYAHEPQSTCGDVNNEIFFKCDELLEHGYPLIQVHDETVLEVPDEYVDEAVKRFQEFARTPLFINDVPLFIPLDISIGKNWGKMTEVKTT